MIGSPRVSVMLEDVRAAEGGVLVRSIPGVTTIHLTESVHCAVQVLVVILCPSLVTIM